MPRDSGGIYTLPLAPVVAGTPIEATWANTTMDDLAVAMTDSLSRSGSGGMQASLKLVDGVVGTPGLNWINEPSSGWYRAGAFDVRGSLAGSDLVRMYQDGGANRFLQFWDGTQWLTILNESDTGFDAALTIKSGTNDDYEGFGVTSTAISLGNEIRITFDNSTVGGDVNKQVFTVTPSSKNPGQSASVVLSTTNTVNIFTTSNSSDALVYPIFVTRVLLP